MFTHSSNDSYVARTDSYVCSEQCCVNTKCFLKETLDFFPKHIIRKAQNDWLKAKETGTIDS